METPIRVWSNKEGDKFPCLITGENLNPENTPDLLKGDLKCYGCGCYQKQRTGRAFIKGAGEASILCTYEPEALKPIDYIRNAPNLSPTHRDQVNKQLAVYRAMGRNMIFCGLCGYKEEHKCPFKDETVVLPHCERQ